MVKKMPLSNLRHPVRAFLTAVEARDGDALRATFEKDAALVEADRRYCRDTLTLWLAELSARQTLMMKPIDQVLKANEAILTVLTIERTRDRSDAEVLRDWHFAINGSHISSLRIEGRPLPDLPPAVASFFRAVNRPDLPGLLDVFVDDALVNDQLRDHWGKEAISDWAAQEILGRHVTFRVTRLFEHYGSVVASANANGSFDRRGLPDPLVLTFIFFPYGDQIAKLIILPAEPAL